MRRFLLLFAILSPLTAFASDMTVNFTEPMKYKCPLPVTDPSNVSNLLTEQAIQNLQNSGQPFLTGNGDQISLTGRYFNLTDAFHMNVLSRTVDVKLWGDSKMKAPDNQDRYFSCRVDYSIAKQKDAKKEYCTSDTIKISNCFERKGGLMDKVPAGQAEHYNQPSLTTVQQ